MLTYLDENGQLQLTDKASMIGVFKNLYDSFEDADLAMAHFGFMHYMYHFDSKFLREQSNEVKRINDVRKFVHRGSEIKVTKTVRKAMDVFKELYQDEAGATYTIMRSNMEKLKEYADKMVLFPPPQYVEVGTELTDANKDFPVIGVDFILVESKEFATITSLLPKQQDELDKFEIHLLQSVKSKIDIYGGGSLGAYE